LAEDGELYRPHRYADGLYRVADPRMGKKKHHGENQIAVRGNDIEDYLRRGYLLRMKGERSGRVSLIAASKIKKI
jgi:hypothetical protein